jgi:hypothetical protein
MKPLTSEQQQQQQQQMCWSMTTASSRTAFSSAWQHAEIIVRGDAGFGVSVSQI